MKTLRKAIASIFTTSSLLVATHQPLLAQDQKKQPQTQEETNTEEPQTTLPPPPPPNASAEDPKVVKLYKRYLLANKKNLKGRAEAARQKIIDNYPESGYARNLAIVPIQSELQTRIKHQQPMSYKIDGTRIKFDNKKDSQLFKKLRSLQDHHAEHPHVVALFAMAIQLELMGAEQNFQKGYPQRMQDNWYAAEHWGKRFSKADRALQKRKIKLANFRSLIRQDQLDEATDFLLDWEIEGDDPQFFKMAQMEEMIPHGENSFGIPMKLIWDKPFGGIRTGLVLWFKPQMEVWWSQEALEAKERGSLTFGC